MIQRNTPADRNYIGIYRFFIILGSVLIIIGLFSEIRYLKIKIRRGNPEEIVYQEHLLNFMLIVVGGLFFGYDIKKYKKEKRIDTSEEYKGV